jgi:enhancing lycopene biosynthesis protein 2
MPEISTGPPFKAFHDQQSIGQRCSRNPATGICLQAIRKSGKSIGLTNVSPADFNQEQT